MSSKTLIVTLAALVLCYAAAVADAQEGRIGAPDGVRQRIEEKARALDLGEAQGNISEYTAVPGGIRGWSQYYERGIVYFVPGHGVLLMSRAMQAAYRGDPNKPMSHTLGF